MRREARRHDVFSFGLEFALSLQNSTINSFTFKLAFCAAVYPLTEPMLLHQEGAILLFCAGKKERKSKSALFNSSRPRRRLW